MNLISRILPGKWFGMAAVASSAAIALYYSYRRYWSKNSISILPGVSHHRSAHPDDGEAAPPTIDISQWSAEDLETLYADFDLAVDFMRSVHVKKLKIDNSIKLKLYALYKASTIGECATARPSMLEFESTAKWNAWNELQGLTRDEAKLSYIHLVSSLVPNWHTLMTTHDGFDSDNDDITDDMLVYDSNADTKRHERAVAARAEAKAAQLEALRTRITQGGSDKAEEAPAVASVSGSAGTGPMGPVFSAGSSAVSVDEDDLALLSQCASAVRELTRGDGEAEPIIRLPVSDDIGSICALDDITVLVQQLGERMGPKVVIEDSFGSSLLHHAADQAAPGLCGWLVAEHGYPVGLRDGSGGTALLNAIAAGSVACVRVLLEAGARVNVEDAAEAECARESLAELPQEDAAIIKSLIKLE